MYKSKGMKRIRMKNIYKNEPDKTIKKSKNEQKIWECTRIKEDKRGGDLSERFEDVDWDILAK